ncbi:hypothetical protein [Neisseria sp. HMSC074B07]|jgi:hypothetical protein|uniref:hypothetical protein n=1 Tax=Neisseria sp. HMSC074B07 TaxID=1715205 RepID=UPI0008A454BD|nr:hypothetical protein [Neisseria sp. HMSC074B07]OFL95286.1 hypothetical protein HMPREF2726_09945 [Neisseria sp. HMSC074B07]
MADELQQPGRRGIVKSQDNIERVSNADIPEFLKLMIESGEITQWREFPNRFFVNGVDKARIIWHTDEQEFGYAYLNELPKEQFEKFRDTYNHIRTLHKAEKEHLYSAQEGALEKTGVKEEPTIRDVVPSSPEERLLAAKHRYLMQDTFLTQPERQKRQFKEYLMEKAIHDMPPDMQIKARANFYESQIIETAKEGFDPIR